MSTDDPNPATESPSFEPGPSPTPTATPTPTPTWTYPTRFCRICREDVAPIVTMYPPGVPPRFQTPIVEYKNEDEYGRLIRPCNCTGSMRYIHELCLLRSRTENRREGSMSKCHTCGYRFNFQKLALQHFLGGKYASGALTVGVMVVIMFFLGFVADPIINMYVEPYETLLGEQSVWDEVTMKSAGANVISSWAQHFMKGLVSMGLVGFLKTILLNPLNWLNLRHNLGMTSARTTTTGRDRAINISWIAVLIGVVSAFYFFYQWVQTVIRMTLKRIGNNIVDTQLPGDDDDLKPPPGWNATREQEVNTPQTSTVDTDDQDKVNPADASFIRASRLRHRSGNHDRENMNATDDSFVMVNRPRSGSDQNSASTAAGTSFKNDDHYTQRPLPREDEALAEPNSIEATAAKSKPDQGDDRADRSPGLTDRWSSDTSRGRSSALDSAHDQNWSFASI